MVLPATSGTYVLIMYLDEPVRIQVGALGECGFIEGWYAYIGSAFGPGGIRARCGRHCRVSKRLRWHVDYLRAQCDLREVWYTTDPNEWEHEWSCLFASRKGSRVPVVGFGSSDCNCKTHLYHSVSRFSYTRFRERMRSTPGQRFPMLKRAET